MTLIASENINAQVLQNKFLINVTLGNLAQKKGPIRITVDKRVQNGFDIIFDTTTKNKNIKFTITTDEPIHGNINFYQKDSIRAITGNTLILANEQVINVVVKENFGINISGAQNQFYKENIWFYLGIPYSITTFNGFNLKWIKRKYDLFLPESYLLFSKYKEYENNVYKSVLRNRALYFNLQKLRDISGQISQQTLEKCYAVIPGSLKKSFDGRLLGEYIKNANKLFIGMTAPDFILSDTLKKDILSSVLTKSNKIMLLDFWASWCGPCRVRMQNLKQLYPKIDTSKIEIVSIAFEDKFEAWLKANREENVPWKSYRDKFEGALSAGRKFTIGYIPYNFIIDKERKIIEREIWDDELLKFLKENDLLLKESSSN